MLYSEAAYFDGAHVKHIADYYEHKRIARIKEKNMEYHVKKTGNWKQIERLPEEPGVYKMTSQGYWKDGTLLRYEDAARRPVDVIQSIPKREIAGWFAVFGLMAVVAAGWAAMS